MVYIGYFAAIGAFVPYITLYYRHLGFAGFQIGILAAILPLGTAFCAPLWGSFADTLDAHPLVLRSCLLLAALATLALAQLQTFLPILLLMIVLSIFVAAVPAVLDAYAMTMSEREGRSYGGFRVWGSIGFIAAVWFVGWQMGNVVSNTFLMAYAVALLLTCGSTFGLPSLQVRSVQRTWQGVASIVKDPSVMLLLFTAYLVLSSASIMSNYLGIYLTELGGTTQLVGTASAIAALSELPVLVFGAWLLDRFTSRRILMLAIIVYFVRFVLYGIPPAPQWVLAIQTLHGLSFGAISWPRSP